MFRVLSFVIAAFLLSSGTAEAQGKKLFASYGQVIQPTAMDAASTSFTVKFDNPASMGIWNIMVVWVTVTDADDSTTAVNMTCTASPDGGTTDYTIQDASVAAGTATYATATGTKNPSATTSPKRWPMRVNITAFPEVECTLTDTGGAADDTIQATVTFAIN